MESFYKFGDKVSYITDIHKKASDSLFDTVAGAAYQALKDHNKKVDSIEGGVIQAVISVKTVAGTHNPKILRVFKYIIDGVEVKESNILGYFK